MLFLLHNATPFHLKGTRTLNSLPTILIPGVVRAGQPLFDSPVTVTTCLTVPHSCSAKNRKWKTSWKWECEQACMTCMLLCGPSVLWCCMSVSWVKAWQNWGQDQDLNLQYCAISVCSATNNSLREFCTDPPLNSQMHHTVPYIHLFWLCKIGLLSFFPLLRSYFLLLCVLAGASSSIFHSMQLVSSFFCRLRKVGSLTGVGDVWHGRGAGWTKGSAMEKEKGNVESTRKEVFLRKRGFNAGIFCFEKHTLSFHKSFMSTYNIAFDFMLFVMNFIVKFLGDICKDLPPIL